MHQGENPNLNLFIIFMDEIIVYKKAEMCEIYTKAIPRGYKWYRLHQGENQSQNWLTFMDEIIIYKKNSHIFHKILKGAFINDDWLTIMGIKW